MASTLKHVRALVIPVLALLAAAPALAQQAKPMKIGVIDPDRIVSESVRGKAVVEKLNKARDERLAQGNKMKQEIAELQKQADAGRLSLGEAKLKQINDQIEDKTIALQRFGENAQRELQKMEQEQMAPLEEEIMKIINQIGQEQGYTMIFKKFQSGLVFADDAIDLSPVVIQRFDATGAAAPAKPAASKPPGH